MALTGVHGSPTESKRDLIMPFPVPMSIIVMLGFKPIKINLHQEVVKRPAGMVPRGIFIAAAQSSLSSNPFTTYYNFRPVGDQVKRLNGY